VAEKKFRSYWQQIATHFAGKSERLIFEALNEETKFEGEGSEEKAYATLTRVNQIFVDTVRKSGKNNEKRLLVVTGYHTDFEKTAKGLYMLPQDAVENKLLLSVHYYTPWTFCGLDEDAEWGKVQHTWGSKADVAKQNELFDLMEAFSKKNDIPIFVGEYNATEKRDHESRVRWVKAVTKASIDRKMIPVLWDTGGEVSRKPPHEASPLLQEVLAASF
jgi:endoglucanase